MESSNYPTQGDVVMQRESGAESLQHVWVTDYRFMKL